MAAEGLKTNDLFQTSSGVGHHWRPGYYFPSSRHQVIVRHRAFNTNACKMNDAIQTAGRVCSQNLCGHC